MRFSLNQSFSTCRLAVAGVSTTVELKSKKSQEREGLRRGSSWSKVWSGLFMDISYFISKISLDPVLGVLLTQQRPFPGQSVSLCPGLQQVETAPAHSSGDPGEAAGQEPASSPPPDPPAVPNAPSAPPYRPSEASQSTLNLRHTKVRNLRSLQAWKTLTTSRS